MVIAGSQVADRAAVCRFAPTLRVTPPARPAKNSGGPSWLTCIGHLKDSLWSLDLFRCESATLRTHWVLVVMDQYTRRIIGFGVRAGTVNGVALCRMFNRAIRWQPWMPKYLSSATMIHFIGLGSGKPICRSWR